AADQDHGVFLQVVAFAGDVAHRFDAGGETHLGDLTKGRVRLLRGGGVDPGADAAALRAALQGGDLVARRLRLARLADELVDCRHLFSLGRRVPFGRSASGWGPGYWIRSRPSKRKNSPERWLKRSGGSGPSGPRRNPGLERARYIEGSSLSVNAPPP